MPWDSGIHTPTGALGSSSTEKMFLQKNFLNFDAVGCQLAESTQLCEHSARASVLQTRFMDNAYLALCNVPTHTHHKLRQFVEILHQTIHNIKMKWEPTGVRADWCDTRPFSAPALNMTLKGVPFTGAPEPATTLWDRWPDWWSPNCPTVLGSMIPALVGKSFALSGCRLALTHNVQRVVQGRTWAGQGGSSNHRMETI